VGVDEPFKTAIESSGRVVGSESLSGSWFGIMARGKAEER